MGNTPLGALAVGGGFVPHNGESELKGPGEATTRSPIGETPRRLSGVAWGVVAKHPCESKECRTVFLCVYMGGRGPSGRNGGAMIHPPCRPPPPRAQLRSRRRESDLGSPSPSSSGHQALGGRGHKSHIDDPSADATVPRGFCERTTAVSGRRLIIERDLNAPCTLVFECGQRSNLPSAPPPFEVLKEG